jgi:hypothetical protein
MNPVNTVKTVFYKKKLRSAHPKGHFWMSAISHQRSAVSKDQEKQEIG